MSARRNCDPATLNRRLAFGAAVRDARTAAGIPQWRLAELAGCDRQSINRIENGAYSPSLDSLWRLADALHVPLSGLCAAGEHLLDDTVRMPA